MSIKQLISDTFSKKTEGEQMAEEKKDHAEEKKQAAHKATEDKKAAEEKKASVDEKNQKLEEQKDKAQENARPAGMPSTSVGAAPDASANPAAPASSSDIVNARAAQTGDILLANASDEYKQGVKDAKEAGQRGSDSPDIDALAASDFGANPAKVTGKGEVNEDLATQPEGLVGIPPGGHNSHLPTHGQRVEEGKARMTTSPVTNLK